MKQDNLRRKCLRCGKLLPPGTNKLRKFCMRVMLHDGTVFNCKDDYHNEKRRPEYHSTKELNRRLIAIEKKLAQLCKNESCELPRHEISLTKEDFSYARIMVNPETNNKCFVFLSYTLELIGENKFKITKNDNETSAS